MLLFGDEDGRRWRAVSDVDWWHGPGAELLLFPGIPDIPNFFFQKPKYSSYLYIYTYRSSPIHHTRPAQGPWSFPTTPPTSADLCSKKRKPTPGHQPAQAAGAQPPLPLLSESESPDSPSLIARCRASPQIRDASQTLGVGGSAARPAALPSAKL